jgi:hypothetical protein
MTNPLASKSFNSNSNLTLKAELNRSFPHPAVTNRSISTQRLRLPHPAAGTEELAAGPLAADRLFQQGS